MPGADLAVAEQVLDRGAPPVSVLDCGRAGGLVQDSPPGTVTGYMCAADPLARIVVRHATFWMFLIRRCRRGPQDRLSTIQILGALAAITAILGALSAERYRLLWLSAVPVLLLLLERRTTPSVADQLRRRHLLPIFPLAHGVLSVTLQSWLFGRNDVQNVLMYAFFIFAVFIMVWQLLKFGGVVAGSRRPRIDIP